MKLEYKMADSPALFEQAAENLEKSTEAHARRVDGLLGWLLSLEWPFIVIMALILTPRTWAGGESRINPHLLAAILAGPVFIAPAVLAIWRFPCAWSRHAAAVAQILVSILLIDITGGRIESHFHIFGSLAILAFYRDWRILMTASLLTAIDHGVRGIWFPEQVYGVLTASPWRWAEHAAWVAFEDFFLIVNNANSRRESSLVAMREAQLSWGAYYDVLTGLPNRRALQEHFDSEVVQDPWAKRTVMFIDLDRFKQANDILGHAVGDSLLKLVTNRLRSTLGKRCMLARIGGDEFVAILPMAVDSCPPELEAERLLSDLTAPFDVDGHRLLLSASIGMAVYPEHGRDLGELQERADRAMYAAKAQGRGQAVMFSSAVARREMVLQEVARDLLTAISSNQMRLCFQPLIQKDGNLTGFEALVRWNHPVHGAIPPLDFIPLAETSGEIIRIGRWILKEAIRNCVAWNRAGHVLSVAVNVSAVQLEQPDFASEVISILDREGLDARLLTIELTESVLVREGGKALHHLAALRLHGVRVALDDFGTGYSSLSYLATLPADTIKLDRSFLSHNTGAASAVVESVVTMAHKIGMNVIAEGVETEAQRIRLQSLNCDQMQGFYFSPPITAEDITTMLTEGAPGARDDAEMPVAAA